MTEAYRHGMGFSARDRELARSRANGKCEFPEGCENKNTGSVSHITGVFEAFLDLKDPRPMGDIDLNAILLCNPHELQHDAQEEFQIECLKGERVIYERRTKRKNQTNAKRAYQRSFGQRGRKKNHGGYR